MKPLGFTQWEEARVTFRIMLIVGIASSLTVLTSHGVTPLFLGIVVGLSLLTFVAMLFFHRWRA